jgi:outer membrane cobalamin receptor
LLLIPFCGLAQGENHTLSIQVSERDSHEAVVMATLKLMPAEIMTVTDVDGRAVMRNVPSGDYVLQISYVGYEIINAHLKVVSDKQLRYVMQPTSLALKEVKVTARQRESGASTASVIGRQAIDHLQATSLADVMQLVPGQLMGNHDLTQSSNLQLRTLVNNNTSAFGSSIVVDGMPMSNNGAMTAGGFSSTAFTGTDLRQVAADNIEDVEVIRGIPSAEYGDLTSGLVVVRSKVGVTPFQVRAKVNPALQNYSAGKGFNLGKMGILNLSADYAKAWGDPREKTRSYDRYTLTLGYGKDISRRWHTDTKLRLMQAKDWNGNDPDAQQDGNETKNKNLMLGITHNGRVQMDMPLARTLKYTIGLNYTQTDNRTTAFVGKSTGRNDIVTAMTTGYNNVGWIQGSYQATGITESRPGNLFVKITDDFFWRKGKTVQSFKIGADYRYDWNHAKGYYNGDDAHPYKVNDSDRPRPFYDIPGISQISAFAEDNFSYNINKVNRLRVNFGLRFSSMQPFSNVSTVALSPRLNVAFSLTKWLDLRAGIGMNSKAPGINHLYPDKKYVDRVAVQDISQSDPVTSIVNYHTVVYDVEYSRSLKNATTTKVEAGVDVKLPGNRRLSFLAYHDKTPNGFGNETEYLAYYHNTYEDGKGYVLAAGQPTLIRNYDDYATRYFYYMTTGKVGNTNTTVNRGVEFDCDLGELKPIRTSVYLSGAWNETKTWDTNLNTENPEKLPTGAPSDYTPVKFVFPSGLDFTRYRRFVTTLRLVTHIPELKMVASLTGQAIWHNSNWSYKADKNPIGWIHTADDNGQLTVLYDEIGNGMLDGYIGYDDGRYYSADNAPGQPVQPYLSIAENKKAYTDTEPTETSVTWNTQLRLTKELGRVGSLSFYVSNALFYEPFLSTNKSSTLTQRNTGTFSFGAELSLNL